MTRPSAASGSGQGQIATSGPTVQVGYQGAWTDPVTKQPDTVIRVALGETDVDISDIKPPELLHTIVFYLFVVLGAKFSVDGLITEAENIAFGRGWKPPLAD